MTAERKHTPGPWTGYMSGLAGEECWHIGPQGQPFVALVFPGSDGDDDWHPSGAEVEANARLIAAAPQLLEVCRLMLAFHAADTQAFVEEYGTGMTSKDVCDHIRSAIAKAEGRTP